MLLGFLLPYFAKYVLVKGIAFKEIIKGPKLLPLNHGIMNSIYSDIRSLAHSGPELEVLLP